MKPTKKKMPFLIVLGIALFFMGCSAPREHFSKKDARAAQKLIGIRMSKMGMDTLFPYLRRNRDGYDSVRKYPLGNDLFPAVRFDPRPHGFTMPAQLQSQGWDIPEGVEIPRPYELLAFYTIPQLASLIKHQKISATELTHFFLDRLKKYQPLLQCTITLTDSLAMAQA